MAIRSRDKKEREEAGQAYIQKREKLASKIGELSRTAGRALIPEEEAKLKREQAEAIEFGEPVRRAQFQHMTGSDVLAQQLKEGIGKPLDLSPTEPIFEGVPKPVVEAGLEAGLQATGLKRVEDIISLATGGKIGVGQFAETKIGKVLGAGIAGAGGGALAAGALLSIPAVTQAVASSVIGKSVLGAGGSIPFLNTAVATVGIYLVGGRVLDIRGGEMDNLRSGWKKVVEDGERIEAATRNGLPNTDSIALLRIMEEEVSFAERRIKELGLLNFNYRLDKDYLLDQQNVRSARESLLRRVLAVENIAATGQAALDPEALLFNAAQFEGGGL